VGNILIGLPMSYVFGIVAEGGLSGFFLGIAIGNACINAFYAYIAVSRNWSEIAERVSKTMQKEE
jgi:Na+-driven multidrug efflux pump